MDSKCESGHSQLKCSWEHRLSQSDGDKDQTGLNHGARCLDTGPILGLMKTRLDFFYGGWDRDGTLGIPGQSFEFASTMNPQNLNFP